MANRPVRRPRRLKPAADAASPATFSDQLREALRATGLSLKELSRRTGIDDGRLSRFMRGERSFTLDSVDKLGSEVELIARFPIRRKRA